MNSIEKACESESSLVMETPRKRPVADESNTNSEIEQSSAKEVQTSRVAQSVIDISLRRDKNS